MVKEKNPCYIVIRQVGKMTHFYLHNPINHTFAYLSSAEYLTAAQAQNVAENCERKYLADNPTLPK